MPRQCAHRAGLAGAMLVLCCVPVRALEPEVIGALTLFEWRRVSDARVLNAQWLADGSAVAYGGYAPETGEPFVAVAPPGPGNTRRLTGAASPHFAVAPRARTVAYWQSVASEHGASAELSLLDLSVDLTSTLGAPRSVNPAMHIAWLDDTHLIFTFERPEAGVASLFAADTRGGPPEELLRLDGCSWTSLEPTGAGDLLASVRSAPGLRRYLVSLEESGTVSAVPADVAFALDGAALELDADGQLIRSTSRTEATIVDTGVTGLCIRRADEALIYTKSHSLLVAALGGGEPRLLQTHSQHLPALSGCAWSPMIADVCAWSSTSLPGGLWCGRLGTETVTGRFRFNPDSTVIGGRRLWVAPRFLVDDAGVVTEPDWKTLKACFEVTRVLRASDFIIAEARSIGTQGGAVERLTGSPDPPPLDGEGGHIRIGTGEERPMEWMSSFRARPIPGMAGWLEGTSEVGAMLSVDVERRALAP